jgi:uncharacterized SAM-binding protein YcdF (DUF218 family)
MQLHEKSEKCDAVFCLCVRDTRVAERAVQLFLDGYGEWLIFSGGFGKLTKDTFAKPEAEVYADIALGFGVPKDRIIIENKSANTGQNIELTYKLLQDRDLQLHSFLLVQKPYMERRTYATFKKQWPDADTEIFVTSPQIPYEKYFNDDNPKELIINLMVGDLQRIREYPKLGLQIGQDIPAEVWTAYEKLVAAGYDKHLIT